MMGVTDLLGVRGTKSHSWDAIFCQRVSGVPGNLIFALFACQLACRKKCFWDTLMYDGIWKVRKLALSCNWDHHLHASVQWWLNINLRLSNPSFLFLVVMSVLGRPIQAKRRNMHLGQWYANNARSSELARTLFIDQSLTSWSKWDAP